MAETRIVCFLSKTVNTCGFKPKFLFKSTMICISRDILAYLHNSWFSSKIWRTGALSLISRYIDFERWAGVRAKYRSAEHLNLPGGVTVAWWGVRGMGWDDFIHQMQLPVLFRSPPKVILLHLGGNDLVQHSLKVVFKLVQESVEYLATALPDVVLLWVNILQRSNWRAPALENRAIEKNVKRWISLAANSWEAITGTCST